MLGLGAGTQVLIHRDGCPSCSCLPAYTHAHLPIHSHTHTLTLPPILPPQCSAAGVTPTQLTVRCSKLGLSGLDAHIHHYLYRTHTDSHRDTRTHTHAHTDAHARTQTYTHTHTPPPLTHTPRPPSKTRKRPWTRWVGGDRGLCLVYLCVSVCMHVSVCPECMCVCLCVLLVS